MDELKHIVVKIIREMLSADEIHIIVPKDRHEHGGIVWRKATIRSTAGWPVTMPPTRTLSAHGRTRS